MIEPLVAPARSCAGSAPPPPPVPGKRGRKAAVADRGRRILIVEDEIMIAWWLQTLLEEMGYDDVAIACSGEDALDAAGRDMPDLMVMDINLGSSPDGIEIARRIRSASAVPVIFVSAYADEASRLRIAEAVPDARLLAKPVSIDGFQQAVRDVLARPSAN